jgi:ribosomal protein L36
MLRADTVVFATDDSAEGIEDAKAWARLQKLTPEDVRIVKREGQCLVIAKRPIFSTPVLSP